MLVEFRVENHRSVRDEQVLTMEEGRVGGAEDARPRSVAGHSTRLLPVAALYGANASGKSNVLGGLAFMRHAVMRSHRMWPPEGGVPRDSFAWGSKASEPSLFEVTLLIDGVRYQYGFVANDERFLEEWLYAWPQGRKQTWFEREGDAFKFGEHLQGEFRVVEQVTRPNALFLSAAVQHRFEQLTPLYTHFRSLQLINISSSSYPRAATEFPELWLSRFAKTSSPDLSGQLTLLEMPEANPDEFDAFRELLRAADVGIVDVKVTKEENDESPPLRGRRPRRLRILVKHQSASEDAWLPLEEESKGTLTLFNLAPAVLDVLWTGGILVVDELEASLHPLLGLHIVQQFNDPVRNPRNAQLLFTTHDTNLLGTTLGEPALRRDQIWLTEKDKEGASRIYPLTDYKPRKEENLERGYLQGRYGAIPFLGELPPVKD
ncbi:AAA family ATPase [Corallococcus exiguus]|uniref:AAA family ATPase n=1 Tax=Corallococcus exiguus TaxID=83462 RepID=UPI00155F9FD1|nr:ATP-binding protein [Corallococcus exiguus]NRD51017.1 ATP-binding protein [Corallococcus exiguus]